MAQKIKKIPVNILASFLAIDRQFAADFLAP